MRASACAATTAEPDELRVTPGGGWSIERIVSITRCWRSSGIRRIPNASVAERRSALITLRRSSAGSRPSSPRSPRRELRAAFASAFEESGSENAGHSAAVAHAGGPRRRLRRVAEALEHGASYALIHSTTAACQLVALQEHVDLPADPRFALEHVEALKRGQVLRHELRDVRLHVRLRGERPAGDREHRPAPSTARAARVAPARAARESSRGSGIAARARGRRARRRRSPPRPARRAARWAGPTRCPARSTIAAEPPSARTCRRSRRPRQEHAEAPGRAARGEQQPEHRAAHASAAVRDRGPARRRRAAPPPPSPPRASRGPRAARRCATAAGSHSPPRGPRAPGAPRASPPSASPRRARGRRR